MAMAALALDLPITKEEAGLGTDSPTLLHKYWYCIVGSIAETSWPHVNVVIALFPFKEL